MFSIQNDGPRITQTDYWGTENAKRGLCYLSGNAGTLRLLVPAALSHVIAEMRTGRSVTIEPGMLGDGTVDLWFEDGTETPFALTIDRKMIDRALQPGKSVPFAVYDEGGLVLELPANIR